MAVWKCSVCGYEYDEDKEGVPFSELKECPQRCLIRVRQQKGLQTFSM